MSGAIEFRLNGKAVRVDSVSPNTTLLEWLRASGLTGSKEGCAEGDCGACSVAIVDRNVRGKRCYRAINSCLVPLPLMAGRDIISVEGVACPKLHPVQQAMVENFGSQCGYCTPGFIMSLFEGYYRKDLKTAAQLDEQLCGNLGRCTGYRPIRDAAADAFAQRNHPDEFDAQLKTAKAKLKAARYSFAGETFLRPASLEKLFRDMAEHPGARLIAGATDLGLEIAKRFQRFPTLIAVEAVAELNEISFTETEWRIGAATTLTKLDDLLGAEFPEIREMLPVFGSRQIRNRATRGGNLVTASPIGDSAPVLLALDASVVLASAAGERILPLDEFFVAYRKTALQSGEILKSIIIPRPWASIEMRRRFYKVSKRREMDISTVAACFCVALDENGTITKARLAYGGVAALPARAKNTEAALIGKRWSDSTCAEMLPFLEKEFTPISDVRGSAVYRQQLIANLLRKFFEHDASEARTRGRASLRRDMLPHVPNVPHESAHKHATGEAIYVDDVAQQQRMLEDWT